MTFLPPFPRFLMAVWITLSIALIGFFLVVPGSPSWWWAPIVVACFVALPALFGLLLEGPGVFTKRD